MTPPDLDRTSALFLDLDGTPLEIATTPETVVARALVSQDHPRFRPMPEREAVEIGPRAASKGHAVERLMTQTPFQGRPPIFLSGDLTDEPACWPPAGSVARGCAWPRRSTANRPRCRHG